MRSFRNTYIVLRLRHASFQNVQTSFRLQGKRCFNNQKRISGTKCIKMPKNAEIDITGFFFRCKWYIQIWNVFHFPFLNAPKINPSNRYTIYKIVWLVSPKMIKNLVVLTTSGLYKIKLSTRVLRQECKCETNLDGVGLIFMQDHYKDCS